MSAHLKCDGELAAATGRQRHGGLRIWSCAALAIGAEPLPLLVKIRLRRQHARRFRDRAAPFPRGSSVGAARACTARPLRTAAATAQPATRWAAIVQCLRQGVARRTPRRSLRGRRRDQEKEWIRRVVRLHDLALCQGPRNVWRSGALVAPMRGAVGLGLDRSQAVERAVERWVSPQHVWRRKSCERREL